MELEFPRFRGRFSAFVQ